MQHDFVFVVSKYNFCVLWTKETGKNQKAPVPLLHQAGKNECLFYIRFILVPLFLLRSYGILKESGRSDA